MRFLERPLAVAAVAVFLVWLWMTLTVHYNYQGNWTALFCIGDKIPPPPQLAKSERLYLFPNSSGYDGQFYHDLAHDPGLTHGYEKYIDAPQLRQRRILIPALAWLLAFGRQQWIDRAYFTVMLGFLAAGVYWLASYALNAGRTVWWGLLYLAVPSTIISMDRMLTDMALVTLFMGFAYYLRSGSLRMLWPIAAAACLTRETGLLIVGGYAIYLPWRRQYVRHLLFSTALLPFLLWSVFVSRHTPRGGQGSYPFHVPLSAIIEAIVHPQSYPLSTTLQTLFTVFDLVSLFAFLAALILACRIAWRDRALGSITVPFVALALLAGSLYGMAPEFDEVYAYGRAFGMLLLVLVLDSITRRSRLGLSLFAVVSLRAMFLVGSQAAGVFRGILR